MDSSAAAEAHHGGLEAPARFQSVAAVGRLWGPVVVALIGQRHVGATFHVDRVLILTVEFRFVLRPVRRLWPVAPWALVGPVWSRPS